ncbi:MAG: hypothetical protein M1546_16545 [Chloroflexi bacterium]|nr:hypothetical protein [Chloroflexota bacterium]
MSDRQAFEQFLRDAHTVHISVEYRGELHTIEHIFYKWLRCELVHEGGIPIDIHFVEDAPPETMLVRAGGHPDYILKLSHRWFHHIIQAVVSAPETAQGFPQTACEEQ